MKNPIRRNKNIGTSKQGHGKNNKMVIPYVASAERFFYESLENYSKTYRTINGNPFEFVIEETRADSQHACSIGDIAEVLRHVTPAAYGRLNLIILRQPKRKEEILSPVWGRLIYSYLFEENYRPAIILEAIPINHNMKWSKHLNPDQAKELERLQQDGHQMISNKRKHIIHSSLAAVRNTQLYRTLPHEIGHYKHFLEMVGERDKDVDEEAYQKREAAYHKLATDVKEKYAHRFADEFHAMLIESKAIPFERIEEMHEE